MNKTRGYEFDLTGKTAMVTGGAGGIGLAIAEAFARYGAAIALCDIQDEAVKAAAKRIEAEFDVSARPYLLDVTKTDQIDAVVKAIESDFGSIHVLVNSAGINIPQIAEEVTENAWDKVLDINLKGAFFCCQAVGKTMIRNNYGKIINISSQAGSVGLIRRSAYCASKGGMNQMSKVLAVEWAKHNINVNSLSPTFLLTPLTEAMFEEKAFKEYVDSNILFPRLATTDDLVGAAVFLASRASDMVTGTDILVDGGWTAH